MERHEFRIHEFQEVRGRISVLGMLVDMPTGRCMNGWHGNPTREPSIGRLPEIRLREVVTQCLRIENDLGHHSVRPLVGEKGCQFLLCPFLVVVGISDGDESGIPIPLMGIQAGGRPGV